MYLPQSLQGCQEAQSTTTEAHGEAASLLDKALKLAGLAGSRLAACEFERQIAIVSAYSSLSIRQSLQEVRFQLQPARGAEYMLKTRVSVVACLRNRTQQEDQCKGRHKP